MGSAPRKKFLRLQKPRNVHVSIKLWHFEWDTPGFLRRYARDHKRLAIDTCSIPSLYAVWYWIEKHTERRIKAGKSRIEAGTGNITKNNKREYTYLVPHWCRNLGLIDMEQRLQKPQLRKQRTCAISDQTLLRTFKLTQDSFEHALFHFNRPYLIWAAVSCLFPNHHKAIKAIHPYISECNWAPDFVPLGLVVRFSRCKNEDDDVDEEVQPANYVNQLNC